MVNFTSRTIWSLLAVVVLLLAGTNTAFAVSAEPTYGAATVDGSYSEWNLSNDLYMNMHEAGRPTKDLLSKSYLRYDCANQVLYVLVLKESGHTVSTSASDAWLKIYDIKNSPMVDGNSSMGNPLPNFAWVYGAQQELLGYEAAFSLAPGFYAEIEIHINIDDGRTSSTGKDGSPLSIICEAEEKASLGDKVWFDENKNGLQDRSENGVANVTVELLDCDNNNEVLQTTTTDGNGVYGFDVAPGSYKVKFYLPAGAMFTTQDIGGNDAIDSDADISSGETQCLTLANGDENLTLDAGIYRKPEPKASLGDKVWFDENKDGLQARDENGVANVTVELLDCDNNNAVLQTTTTDGNGIYGFDVAPGSYKVKFYLPAGAMFTTQDIGGNDAIDSDADISSGETQCVTLADGDENLTLDAGIYRKPEPKAYLGDKVWFDLNMDGLQARGEGGVPRVKVELLDCENNNTVIETTYTNFEGFYGFDVAPGDYKVKFYLPTGYVFTSPDQGSNDVIDSDANQLLGETQCVTLADGDRNLTLDAGIYLIASDPKASLGDLVWWDQNGDGQQEGDEPGVPNVTVELYAVGAGNVMTLEGTLLTNASGNYNFIDLAPGKYVVKFIWPAGWSQSPQDQTADDADSDPNAMGYTVDVTLADGDNDLTLDAGLYKLPTPSLLCVSPLGDNMFKSQFGYTNPNPKVLTIPVGDANKFTGTFIPFTQPMTFQPGEVGVGSPHIIEVLFAGPNLMWTLAGATVETEGAGGNPELAPIAAFMANMNFGIAPMMVKFTSTSENATLFFWEFSDGQTSEEEHPEIAFDGIHKHIDVQLTVTGCGGQTDMALKTDYVVVSKPSAVNFEASPIAGDPGLEVYFENHSGGNANKHTWYFGDGTMATYQHDWKNKVNPVHTYDQAGEYDVTLKSEGQGGSDMLTLPGMIYVDEDYQYVPLKLDTEGETYAGSGWENAIDHDIYGSGSKVIAKSSDPMAIFKFADDDEYNIYRVRLLRESIETVTWASQLTKTIEIYVSDDGVNFELGLSETLSKRGGQWEVFDLPMAKSGTYVKVVLAEAIGGSSPYRELVELQLFGEAAISTFALSLAKADGETGVIPTSFTLEQNYPNPFNPSTQIQYQLADAAQVRLNVYNVQGQLIQALVSGAQEAGSYSVTWNAQNDFGAAVSAGIYIYQFQAVSETGEAFNFTRKMSYVK